MIQTDLRTTVCTCRWGVSNKKITVAPLEIGKRPEVPTTERPQAAGRDAQLPEQLLLIEYSKYKAWNRERRRGRGSGWTWTETIGSRRRGIMRVGRMKRKPLGGVIVARMPNFAAS